MKTFFPHPLRQKSTFCTTVISRASSVLCSVNPPLEALNTIYFEIHFQIHEIDFLYRKKIIKKSIPISHYIWQKKKKINFLLCSSSMPSNGTRPPLWDPLLFFFYLLQIPVMFNYEVIFELQQRVFKSEFLTQSFHVFFFFFSLFR